MDKDISLLQVKVDKELLKEVRKKLIDDEQTLLFLIILCFKKYLKGEISFKK